MRHVSEEIDAELIEKVLGESLASNDFDKTEL